MHALSIDHPIHETIDDGRRDPVHIEQAIGRLCQCVTVTHLADTACEYGVLDSAIFDRVGDSLDRLRAHSRCFDLFERCGVGVGQEKRCRFEVFYDHLAAELFGIDPDTEQ